jgi:DNA (cytosine-5)-methyltransferase 1
MILDDFAGPGGWDEGLRMIGRTDTVGVEKDAHACMTAAAAGHVRVQADVEHCPLDLKRGDVEGYVSSPPCPDFSTAGRGAGRTGESGRLVTVPLQRVLSLRPEWTAWEQVREVLPIWRECAHDLRAAGYRVWTGLLNAADFGVPQDRIRAVLLASRTTSVTPPTPTHGDGGMLGDLPPHRTLADVIGLEPGWVYDSGQNSVLAGGRIERYRRSCDRPAGTLTTKAASQWNLLGPNGEVRKITVPEASTIQTFPAIYPWVGMREEQLRQIGNAVPPLLSAHIGQALNLGALPVGLAAVGAS